MWKHLSKIWSKILVHPLTASHPLKALTRYVYWQLYYRLISKERTVNWIGPLKISLQKDAPAVNAQYYFGLGDYSEMSFTMHFLREKDLFIDVGAYQGMYTILAAGITIANVIAFEPFSDSFDKLNTHIQLNNLGQSIDARQIALGETLAKGRITTDWSQQNHIELHSIGDNNINISTLDIEISNLGSPSIMKIDVEGYELNIFKGGKDLLQNPDLKAIIIEMMELGVRYGSSDSQVHDLLVNNGFNLYEYDPVNRALKPLTELVSGNGIYLRDIEFVKQRVKTAKVFTVSGINI